MKGKSFSIILIFALLQLALCNYNDVMTQIDRQSQLKHNDTLQKNQLLTTHSQ